MNRENLENMLKRMHPQLSKIELQQLTNQYNDRINSIERIKYL